MHKLITTVFGIGYIKGGGTIAAIVCCVVIFFLPAGTMLHPVIAPAIALLLLLAGVFSSNHVEKEWGKDSYRVVIDEVAGMWITLLFVPVTIASLLAGLMLFRFFDIVKPLYVRRMEALPGDWGVMMDDVLAGVYASLVLNIGIYFIPALTAVS